VYLSDSLQARVTFSLGTEYCVVIHYARIVKAEKNLSTATKRTRHIRDNSERVVLPMHYSVLGFVIKSSSFPNRCLLDLNDGFKTTTVLYYCHVCCRCKRLELEWIEMYFEFVTVEEILGTPYFPRK
jgi:hypothetical protein